MPTLPTVLKPVNKNRIALRNAGVALILLSSRRETEAPDFDPLIARLDEVTHLLLKELERVGGKSKVFTMPE